MSTQTSSVQAAQNFASGDLVRVREQALANYLRDTAPKVNRGRVGVVAVLAGRTDAVLVKYPQSGRRAPFSIPVALRNLELAVDVHPAHKRSADQAKL